MTTTTPSHPGANGTAPIQQQDLQSVVADLLERVQRLEELVLQSSPEDRPDQPQLVSLNQAAAMVRRTKEALRHYPDMPEPTVPGRRGQPNLWDWAIVRPWLEAKFNMILPQRFFDMQRFHKERDKD